MTRTSISDLTADCPGTFERISEKGSNKVSVKRRVIGVAVSLGIVLSSGIVTTTKPSFAQPDAVLLATGLEGALGSSIGPGGALYVTEAIPGRVSQVDPQSGEITTFASGLPARIAPIGGVSDVAFIGETAYVLVTMVGSDLDPNSENVVGIYRVDGPDSFTVIADIGEFTINNPSESEVFIPSGVHYAMDVFDGGFVVTDGHHNWVLHVTLDGEVSVMMPFDNIVPTGLAVWGDTVYMAEAGPNPHTSEGGRIVSFGTGSTSATDVASGAPLLLDVAYGVNGKLYALSQGDFPEGSEDGTPAIEYTGALVQVNSDGTFTVIADGLNQPTSFEFIGNTVYVVSFSGEIWTIDGVF